MGSFVADKKKHFIHSTWKVEKSVLTVHKLLHLDFSFLQTFKRLFRSIILQNTVITQL